MKKKQYKKPSLQVVVLNQQTALLAGSEQGQATLPQYDYNDVPEE